MRLLSHKFVRKHLKIMFFEGSRNHVASVCKVKSISLHPNFHVSEHKNLFLSLIFHISHSPWEKRNHTLYFLFSYCGVAAYKLIDWIHALTCIATAVLAAQISPLDCYPHTPGKEWALSSCTHHLHHTEEWKLVVLVNTLNIRLLRLT